MIAPSSVQIENVTKLLCVWISFSQNYLGQRRTSPEPIHRRYTEDCVTVVKAAQATSNAGRRTWESCARAVNFIGMTGVRGGESGGCVEFPEGH